MVNEETKGVCGVNEGCWDDCECLVNEGTRGVCGVYQGWWDELVAVGWTVLEQHL